MLSTVNRVLLGLAGLVLICGGGAVLAAGLGLSVPSWWPWDGKTDVLLSRADRDRWRADGWWWPTVIVVLAVLVVLALWWFFAQLRRARLAEVLVESGDGEGRCCAAEPWRTCSPGRRGRWTGWPVLR